MDKQNRMNDAKETIKKKIDSIAEEQTIARLYAQIVGCTECTFQFTCDKRKPCNVTMLRYIKTGDIL